MSAVTKVLIKDKLSHENQLHQTHLGQKNKCQFSKSII